MLEREGRGRGTYGAGAGGILWAFVRGKSHLGVRGAAGGALLPMPHAHPRRGALDGCVHSPGDRVHLAGEPTVCRQTQAFGCALLLADLPLCSHSGPRGPGAGGAGQHHLPVRAGQEDHRHLLAV